MRRAVGNPDFDEMAIDWCQKVNGVTISPQVDGLGIYFLPSFALRGMAAERASAHGDKAIKEGNADPERAQCPHFGNPCKCIK